MLFLDLDLTSSIILSVFGGLIVGAFLALLVFYLISKKRKNSILKEIENAKIEAQKIVKKAELNGLDVVANLKKEFEASTKEKRQEIYDLQSKLTQREKTVLKLITQGYGYKQISKQIFVSTHTVKAHISSIIRKLEAKNRTNAVYIAMIYHLLDE